MVRVQGVVKHKAAWPFAVALAWALAACSTAPYEIVPPTDPPWETLSEDRLPHLDPPLSDRARRISICYGTSVNSEEDVVALAEKACDGGRLVLEGQNVFWNGCSVLQPNRATYICDPPPEAASAN